jgi:hypothetical protein
MNSNLKTSALIKIILIKQTLISFLINTAMFVYKKTCAINSLLRIQQKPCFAAKKLDVMEIMLPNIY